jgi:hypothetical protein
MYEGTSVPGRRWMPSHTFLASFGTFVHSCFRAPLDSEAFQSGEGKLAVECGILRVRVVTASR